MHFTKLRCNGFKPTHLLLGFEQGERVFADKALSLQFLEVHMKFKKGEGHHRLNAHHNGGRMLFPRSNRRSIGISINFNEYVPCLGIQLC